MINTDGKTVKLAGSSMDLLQDYVNITREFRNMFTSKVGRESANIIVALCGRIAFAEDPKEEELHMEKLAEFLIETQGKTK